MNRTFYILLVFTLFLAFSCKKEQKQLPVCIITHPKAGQEFFEDEDIPVKISAPDDKIFITSVLLYIDGKCYGGTSEFPYNFTVKAGDLALGEHTIKAIATNNEGKQGEASIMIKVNSVHYESPDFVDFSDGKLPMGWKTTGWHINPTKGYDDFSSLFSRTDSATVITTKTCNYMEFYYTTFRGTINLYVDDVLWETLDLHNWGKCAIDIPYGFHSFKWEALIVPQVGQRVHSANIDNIRFEIKD
jgi:hypothetical protein